MRVLLHHLLCPELGCGKSYTNKVHLNVHLRREHQIEAFRCKVRGCIVSFATLIQLTDHRKCAHSQLKTWPCGLCDATFPLYRQLFSHSWLVHETGRFGCRIGRCNFTETTRIMVDNHQRTFKHSQTVYGCPIAGCTKTYNGIKSLNAHQRAHEHGKQKKQKRKPSGRSYVCLACKQTFNRTRDLVLHKINTHMSVSFHCKWPGCEYASNLGGSVYNHVRGRHFGLPVTKKEQEKRSIIDNRNAGDFVEKRKKAATAN